MVNIEFDEDLLIHDIIDLNGITILCPRLLASDIAHEIYIDWYADENGKVPTDYVFSRCYDKLYDVISQMVKDVEDILEDNDMWLA